MVVNNRGPQIEAVAILFLALSIIFVALRCYVRAVMMKGFGLDDWLSLAALALFVLYCIFVLKGVQYGTGRHLVDLPQANVPIALKWWWCCELAYIASTCLLKLSIGVFLGRICIHKGQKLTIWVVMAGMSIFSVVYFFIIVFQCSPVVYFWTQYSGGIGSCVNPSVVADSTYAHSAVSAVADWTLGILPVFLVWNLAMSPRTKISVALILALGAVGSTATIVRIPYINQLTETSDFLFSTTDVAIWSTVEPGIGITAAAMATLRPLFQSFLARSKLLGSSSHAYPKPSGSAAFPNRQGYFRSGSGPDGGRNAGTLELGLRTDIGKGDGITTVIKSAHDKSEDSREPRKLEKTKSRGDEQGLKKGMSDWSTSESRLKFDDSSSEDLPASWTVRKHTEVTTTSQAITAPPVPEQRKNAWM
ncbi:hypothetical protein PVAG01_00562 [Phlyctema vagabunda]|uniref:Rhodopsin domain-containing protein n=1 Tax=Phlyctema vagabunda TaxID=108571 RepID=A0ABR4PUL7_9HELO